MKLQVTQENLNRALGIVARVASTRNALPILSNILIRTSNNRLSLAATNLDIAIAAYIGAKVAEEGSVTVPGRLMQDFIGSLPAGVIELGLDESKLHITTDQYKSSVNGMAADEFPSMPEITGGTSWTLSGPALKKALQQVVFAASGDESRPVLTGVLIQAAGGRLTMAATDSYRLAEKSLGENGGDMRLLVPATAMQDLLRIVGDFEEDVEVTHDDQQVLFRVGEIELVARLIDGRYPDYRRLIPAEFAITAELKKADFVNVTKVAALFARESAGGVTIDIDDDAQRLSINSVASQLGENTGTAPVKATGSGSITLNSRYLLDGLGALQTDTVRFCFNGKLEATMLTDAKAGGDYVHIIMPLKS